MEKLNFQTDFSTRGYHAEMAISYLKPSERVPLGLTARSQTAMTQRPRHVTAHFESMEAQTTYNMTRPLGASKHHITSESFNVLRGEVT